MTSVVLADDHAFLRTGVEALLRSAGIEVLASVENGQRALDAVAQVDPDVVVLDIRMPVLDGIATAQALRASNDNRPIVLLAAEVFDEHIQPIIEAGVNAVVMKHCAEQRLIDAIRTASEGHISLNHDIMGRALSLGDARQGPAWVAKLTRRELQLVELVADGLRNQEIADRLSITEGTVKVTLHGIFSKVGAGNRTVLARMYNEAGLKRGAPSH